MGDALSSVAKVEEIEQEAQFAVDSKMADNTEETMKHGRYEKSVPTNLPTFGKGKGCMTAPRFFLHKFEACMMASQF